MHGGSSHGEKAMRSKSSFGRSLRLVAFAGMNGADAFLHWSEERSGTKRRPVMSDPEEAVFVDNVRIESSSKSNDMVLYKQWSVDILWKYE